MLAAGVVSDGAVGVVASSDGFAGTEVGRGDSAAGVVPFGFCGADVADVEGTVVLDGLAGTFVCVDGAAGAVDLAGRGFGTERVIVSEA